MCNTGLLHNKRNPGGLVLSPIFICKRNCTIVGLESQGTDVFQGCARGSRIFVAEINEKSHLDYEDDNTVL